jgi:hypothetical protein
MVLLGWAVRSTGGRHLGLCDGEVLAECHPLALQAGALSVLLGDLLLRLLELSRELARPLIRATHPIEQGGAILSQPLELRRQAQGRVLRRAPVSLRRRHRLRSSEAFLDGLVALPCDLSAARLGAVGRRSQRRTLVAQPLLRALQ